MDEENLFPFIKDVDLRTHLADSLEVSSELAVIAKGYPEAIESSLYKTVIIHLASMVEGLLHYLFIEKVGAYYEAPDWSYINIKVLHELEDDDRPNLEIIAGKRYKKKNSSKGLIDFFSLIEMTKKEKLITEDMAKEINKIRKLRNKVHIYGQTTTDGRYSRSQIEEVAGTANKVIRLVERISNK